jgi:hypothetical protein
MDTRVMNGGFYSLPYNTLNDFVPVAPLVTIAFVLFARKTMVPNDLNELIAWLKANPNRASTGFTNNGIRLLAGFFQKETGTQSIPAATPRRPYQLSEIRLVRGRHPGLLSCVVFMRVVGADGFRPLAERGKRALVNYGG